MPEKGAKSAGLGPHGVGDPNDKSLRRVELDVLIREKVRKKAKERCRDVMNVFGLCAQEQGLLAPFRCRDENFKQLECINRWMYDPELVEKMTQEYLDERSYYRATGEPKVKVQPRKH